jgi:hypothetical protein
MDVALPVNVGSRVFWSNLRVEIPLKLPVQIACAKIVRCFGSKLPPQRTNVHPFATFFAQNNISPSLLRHFDISTASPQKLLRRSIHDGDNLFPQNKISHFPENSTRIHDAFQYDFL